MYKDETGKTMARLLKLIEKYPTYTVVPIITHRTDKDEGTYSLGTVNECGIGEYVFTMGGDNVFLKDETDMENVEKTLRDWHTSEAFAAIKQGGDEVMIREYENLPWLKGIIIDITA